MKKLHEYANIEGRIFSPFKRNNMASKKKWIQKAIKHPGALKKELGVKKGEKIPRAKLAKAAKKKGKIGRRARLAETLSGLKKGK